MFYTYVLCSNFIHTTTTMYHYLLNLPWNYLRMSPYEEDVYSIALFIANTNLLKKKIKVKYFHVIPTL